MQHSQYVLLYVRDNSNEDCHRFGRSYSCFSMIYIIICYIMDYVCCMVLQHGTVLQHLNTLIMFYYTSGTTPIKIGKSLIDHAAHILGLLGLTTNTFITHYFITHVDFFE